MLPRRIIMFGHWWRLLMILATTLMATTTIECAEKTHHQSSSSSSSSMEDDLKNIDEMFAMESKRFLQALPYKTTAPSSSSSSSMSLSASQKTELLKEIYRKTAAEFWNGNNNNNNNDDSPSSNLHPDSNDYAQSSNQHYVTMPKYHQSYVAPSYLQQPQQVAAAAPKLPSYGQLLQPRTDYYSTAFNQGYLKGKDIHIEPEHKPITLHYRTHAQPIIVHQQRLPGPKPEVKHTTSQEEPQRVVHEVIRPIIQEVHEIIQPYRRVVQQVQPVIEEVRTIIAKDSGKMAPQPAPLHQDVVDAPLLINNNNNNRHGNGPLPPYHPAGFMKTNQIYHASASNELPRNSAIIRPVKAFRKAPVFDNNNDDDHMIPMMTTQNGQRFIRSRVYLTPKGIPVYQSNYRAPIYLGA